VWEKPADDDTWRVPVLDVEQAIRDAAKRWRVREVAFDPYLWTRSAQILDVEGLPMVEFRQSPARQTAATNDLHSDAVNGRFTHSGDPYLTRHVLNATVLESDKGIRLAKTSRSRHAPKIDLCTALMICHSRCSWLAGQQKPRRRAYSFAS
jgi:phage terminase large subunit-like protein